MIRLTLIITFTCLCGQLFNCSLFAQKINEQQIAWADSIVESLSKNLSQDRDNGEELADSAFNIYSKANRRCGMIRARLRQSIFLDELGKSDVAVENLIWCLRSFDASCDSSSLMEVYVNLSSTYLSLGDFDKTIETCGIGLNLWNNKWPEPKTKLSLLNNNGIALASIGNLTEADIIFRNLLRESSNYNEVSIVDQTRINIGTIFAMNNDLDSAYYYFNEALTSLEKSEDYEGMMTLRNNLAVLQRDRGKYDDALNLFNEYQKDAIDRSDLQRIAQAEAEIAETFRIQGNLDSAYLHISNYIVLKDSLLTQERVKSIAEMQEKYEAVKKAQEIDELKVINLNAALTTEKVKRVRNGMYAGAALLLLTLGFLYVRYRIIRRNRNDLFQKNIAIANEKERSDNLLKNILPDEVAEELKESGTAKAQGFDLVTIFFSDFKGFTTISERLSPSELVGELDICFQAFDHIITRHNLEKIKTIGDAYMAVGGLPDRSQHNPVNMLLAAIEMQEFMMARKIELTAKGWLAFDMRVGIHTGPVVAGVVGVKKFQYDVWGDSVNTASRMESSGEINKVNISEATYELVKDSPLFSFEHRGKISAKGKGEMSMYFVDRA